ncbi:BREX-1 system phosphatase PglZ type A [Pueribacillus sp. YX66]|uniref:BREX-1 system phosphatase PglZ type A n=1 Tax=Pueribacillus sp. YX66 TaxID=3229242 RepID=UPI00358D588B
MNVSKVERELKALFEKELTHNRRRHVVFWYDASGEFLNEVKELELDDVRIWTLTENNLFATKYELETADPDSHFLIYANMPKPTPREDWLFLHYKNGMEYTSDRVTMTMREVGVEDDQLRPVFEKYSTFFRRQTRKETFLSFSTTFDSKEKIDLAVLATLTKSPFLSSDECVRALLKEELKEKNRFWEEVEKYGDVATFWQLMERHYGYSLEERTLSSLFLFFMMTYLSDQVDVDLLPSEWQPYISSRPMNVIVFMNQWMNHTTDREVFNQLADRFAEQVHINLIVENWAIDAIVQADGFRQFDEKVIAYLQEQLVYDVNQFAYYKDILTERRRLHWYSEFQAEYEAIENGRWLLQFVQEKDNYIPDQSAYDLFQAYASDYYRADLFYRKFYTAFDRIERKERLFPLREKIENVYTNWYLQELSIRWTNRQNKELVPTWTIARIAQQTQFYQTYIEPIISSDERAFVIISDALRYEVAKELMDVLNNERKASTDLQAMQGVIPSYTELGMASLLPHETIEYVEGHVVVDDIRAQGLENRKAILQKHVKNAVAFTFQELMAKNRTQLRESLAGQKLIYIYHNTIDARGDHAATEVGVFEAAEAAIHDIRRLVNQLVNNVSASNIFITADHGFLYERQRLEERDKLPKHVEEAIRIKRRYVLSQQIRTKQEEGTLTYEVHHLLDQRTPLYVTVPNGTTRFSIQGTGANYVHGGSMLQEIVIPVITFKNDRSKFSKNMIQYVDVKLTTPLRKVTNQVIYLEFFQTEKVEEKRLPRTFSLYFIDENGERVSNENLLIADSESSEPSERTFKEKFVFRTMSYEREIEYYLILKDEATNEIYDKVPFTIDFLSELN